ncbi:MAG: class I SAM-dependent methyltransferase [Candidatus Levybacteria bacterium]|nr:class I SAM-dependent methyltransferase [Candidatus Levybacteria bacterium]
MIGSEYSRHPEILLDSFKEMKHEYGRKVKKTSNKSLIFLLQKIYIQIFGIPEVGFLIRSLYFKKIISEKVNKERVKNVLDAGSGIGTYSFWLCKMFPKAGIVGEEIDKNKINFSKKFAEELGFSEIDFYYRDISREYDKQKYDLIVNIDVLEHIKDYRKVLKNFYGQLANKGYLYIHTPQPNQERIFSQLKKWHHEDHVREGFVVRQLIKELVDFKFKIIVVRHTFGFFGKLAWEINHILLEKSFILAGLFYPFLIVLSQVDTMINNKKGLGVAILAQKRA